jgi:hypothetical protein
MSFGRIHSRVFTGLLTRPNNWKRKKRHLYIMQLIDSPLCRRYGAEKEISAHIVRECKALATLRHAYLRSFFLDPEDVNSLKSGTIWNFIKGTGHPTFDICLRGTKGLSKKAYMHRDRNGSNPFIVFYSILFMADWNCHDHWHACHTQLNKKIKWHVGPYKKCLCFKQCPR